MYHAENKSNRLQTTKQRLSLFSDGITLKTIAGFREGIDIGDRATETVFDVLPGFSPGKTRSERGFAANAIQDTIRGLGVLAVTLVVLLLVLVEILQAVESDLVGNQPMSDPFNSVRNNTGTALLLSGVALIVVAAVMILNIIQGGRMGGR